MKLLISFTLVLLSVTAQATPVVWTIQADDGPDELVGSFVFDADLAQNNFINEIGSDGNRIEWSDAWYSEVDIDGFFGPSAAADIVYYQCEIEFVSGTTPEGDPLYFRDGCDGTTNRTGLTVAGSSTSFYQLIFEEALTNAGGVVNYSGFLLEGFFCQGICGPISGTVVASVVPVPAAVWLFASALAGLGWMRRKHTI